MGAVINTLPFNRVKQLQTFFRYAHHRDNRRLGDLLIAGGFVTSDILQQALLTNPHHDGARLGEWLIKQGLVPEQAVEQAICAQLGIPQVDLRGFDFEPHIFSLMPRSVAEQYGAIPLFEEGDHLAVAVGAIPGPAQLDALRFATQRKLWVARAEPDAIRRAIREQYSALDEEAALGSVDVEGPDTEEQQLWREAEQLAQQRPIVKMVESFLTEGIQRRASDIHILPYRDRVEVLLRIDGTLILFRTLARPLLPPVVSRIKILSRLNIAERRLPQDGRCRVKVGGDSVDLRISVIPAVFGESVVIRILSSKAGLRNVADIGFTPEDEARFINLLERSHGIFLVTGPTGSGKSTSLYAALQYVMRERVNVVTVEDPVEFELPGACQIQLLQAMEFGVAQTLRHILRHDPDVIMIGEMRDLETCQVALEAALTGHLVLSTLHTNDAPGAITRLSEIGIADYLIRSAVIGVLAQRLVRTNCPHCRVEEEVSPLIRKSMRVGPSEVFYVGKGCDSCHNTGLTGRRAIFELFVVTDEVRDHISGHINAAELRARAIDAGMRPMQDYGLDIARKGDASLMEVFRACM